MAGGWARDDAVNEQIEISTQEAIERAKLRAMRGGGVSAEYCAECDEPIPQARRDAIAGVQLCVACQSQRDKTRSPRGGMNRRAGKDSLLK